MNITIRTFVNPTEEHEKVREALSYFWNSSDFVRNDENNRSVLSLSGNDYTLLESLRQAIHNYRILDVVRKRLRSNWSGTMTTVILSKQAAYSGKLKIIDDTEHQPPLGGIEIIIFLDSEEEFQSFLEWFSPQTSNGEVLSR